ncbi:hypothetical protein ONZ43_g2949 [Nemania bipapillata]|uniref:Uncharacterized protein n=1 Tax=Nemania bipapillata TaxID=110536 RepID=A0ACC2IYP2_9PEZI|nr:hypothetical protein ONZ43_g2949 [Nemania bipapillata]
MSASSNQTCDINKYPSFESLNVPKHVSIGGLATSNETLVAMQICCAPNPVNAIGDCVLWCEIPSNSTEEEWMACTAQLVMEDHITAYRSEATMATAVRPTMVGIATIALLLSGLCAL